MFVTGEGRRHTAVLKLPVIRVMACNSEGHHLYGSDDKHWRSTI